MNALPSQLASEAGFPANTPARTLAILSTKNNSLAIGLLNEFSGLRPEWRCFLPNDGDKDRADLDGAARSCILCHH